MDIAPICLDLINTWSHITKLTFKPDKKITMDLFLKILDNKYLTEINCYEMPSYLIERMDTNKRIKITTRHKYEYSSEFMVVNS